MLLKQAHGVNAEADRGDDADTEAEMEEFLWEMLGGEGPQQEAGAGPDDDTGCAWVDLLMDEAAMEIIDDGAGATVQPM